MTEIKPSEVSQILKTELSGLTSESQLEETGSVLAVGDGIARLYGLQNVESGELIEFNNNKDQQGIVLNLEEDNVGAVLLGSSTDIKEGDIVTIDGDVILNKPLVIDKSVDIVFDKYEDLSYLVSRCRIMEFRIPFC